MSDRFPFVEDEGVVEYHPGTEVKVPVVMRDLTAPGTELPDVLLGSIAIRVDQMWLLKSLERGRTTHVTIVDDGTTQDLSSVNLPGVTSIELVFKCAANKFRAHDLVRNCLTLGPLERLRIRSTTQQQVDVDLPALLSHTMGGQTIAHSLLFLHLDSVTLAPGYSSYSPFERLRWMRLRNVKGGLESLVQSFKGNTEHLFKKTLTRGARPHGVIEFEGTEDNAQILPWDDISPAVRNGNLVVLTGYLHLSEEAKEKINAYLGIKNDREHQWRVGGLDGRCLKPARVSQAAVVSRAPSGLFNNPFASMFGDQE